MHIGISLEFKIFKEIRRNAHNFWRFERNVKMTNKEYRNLSQSVSPSFFSFDIITQNSFHVYTQKRTFPQVC